MYSLAIHTTSWSSYGGGGGGGEWEQEQEVEGEKKWRKWEKGRREEGEREERGRREGGEREEKGRRKRGEKEEKGRRKGGEKEGKGRLILRVLGLGWFTIERLTMLIIIFESFRYMITRGQYIYSFIRRLKYK